MDGWIGRLKKTQVKIIKRSEAGGEVKLNTRHQRQKTIKIKQEGKIVKW